MSDCTSSAPQRRCCSSEVRTAGPQPGRTPLTGWPDTFAIEITKRIPVGGGLGGGSADAGAVLRALDVLAPHPLGPRLPALAAELGADVPFMTLDAPFALGWSRGERLFVLPTLP